MKTITIDFNKYASIGEFHSDIQEILHLPDYYGKNLDALNDMVGEYVKKEYRFAAIYGGNIPVETQKMIMAILNQIG